MSINYYIHEHFVISEKSELSEDIKDYAIGNISILAGLNILGIAEIGRATFTSEKTNIKYTDDLTLEDMKTLAESIFQADTFEMVIDYEFTWYGMNKLSQMAGPFELTALLDETEEGELKGIFYSMWNNADCSDENGILCAYGEKDGKFYKGIVKPEEVKELPQGEWYTTQSVISFECEDHEADADRLEQICRSLVKYSYTDDFKRDDKGIDFYLSNLTLNSEDELNDILSKAEEITEITGEPCLWDMYFTNKEAEADMRLLTVTADEQYKPRFFLAEV